MLVRRQRDVPRTNTPELQIRAEAQVECLRDSGGGVDAVINRREGVGPAAVIFAPVTLYFLIRSSFQIILSLEGQQQAFFDYMSSHHR
jgi:hypothetical protein